ncbi:MAG: PQQ-binding-like beta-propeller repeat protein [Planctomycetota bacterium]
MLLLVGLFVGCGSEPFTYDRPLVEKTRADPVDETLRQQFESRGHGSKSDLSGYSWPAIFGPNRNSCTAAPLSPIWDESGPSLLWQVEVGTGYGSPVTTGNVVLFNHRVDDQEILECRNAATGKGIWQHRSKTSAICDFDYSNGPYSTPVIDSKKQRVYNVSAEGMLKCLKLETGDVIWSRELHRDYRVEADIFPVGASPLLDLQSRVPGGQLLFVLGGSEAEAGIISLSADTGDTLWTATDHQASYTTPVVASVHNQRFGLFLTGEGLVCLDPDTGHLDWDFEYSRRVELARNATSPIVIDDRAIVICSGKGAKCVRLLPDRSYEEVWHARRAIDSQYNTVIASKRHLFSFTSGGQGGAEFRCIDSTDGNLKWSYHSILKRGMGFATPNAFFLLGERGHLAALSMNTDEPRVLSFTSSPLMSEPCYCSPAFAGNVLILKDEQRVAAFKLGEDRLKSRQAPKRRYRHRVGVTTR